MTARDALLLASSGLRGSVLRTLLTILGLGIGVGAVLTVLTLGHAGEIRVEQEIEKMGVNKVWVRAKKDVHALTADDVQQIRQATDSPSCAGAYMITELLAGGKPVAVQIAGYDASMRTVHAPKLLEGRSFRAEEYMYGSPVCLVDEVLAQQIGGTCVGQHIVVANRRLRIVGVIESMLVTSAAGGGAMLIMPLETFLDTFDVSISEVTLSVRAGKNTAAVAEKALAALEYPEAFRADTLENEINAAREVVRIFVMVLMCVACVCVLTGGIGVMNVLLVSVRERRREIGLIKAIGGTAAQIASIFLLEAAAYAFLGGVLGISVGAALIYMMGAWIGLNAGLSVAVAFPVLFGATLLGLLFGAAPAIKAAELAPVDALSSE